MVAVASALEHSYGGNFTTRVMFTESHDVVSDDQRLPVAIDPGSPDSYWSKKRCAIAGVIVLTAPGIPMLFMGQEFLATTPFTVPNHPALDWSEQAANIGLWHLHRDLVVLRRNRNYTTAGLRGANLVVHHVNDIDKVIAYHRWQNGGPKDDVVILVNFANRNYDAYTIGVPRGGEWKVRFCSDDTSYDAGFGGTCPGAVNTSDETRDGQPASLTVPLPAHGHNS